MAKTAKNLTRNAFENSRIGKALKKAHDEAIGKEPDAPAAPPRKPVKPPPIKNWHTAGRRSETEVSRYMPPPVTFKKRKSRAPSPRPR